jgi:ELWxxDGT repeat protein
MRHTLLCFSLAAVSLVANAQVSNVMDINPGLPGSFPTRLTSFNDKLVFFADDGINGSELWSHDSMTQIVYNINPGAASSGAYTNHYNMAVANGKLFFPATDGTTGVELYSWNGDVASTPTIVKDINTSLTPSQIGEVVAIGDKVYFSTFHTTYGYELWMHDAKNGNTNVISNIYAGTNSSNPQNLVEYKGMLLFTATNNTTGTELYKYDPKTNNASLVMDINTGSVSSDPQSLVVVDGKLFFSASTSAYGRELYSYDSTSVVRLTDLFTGSGNGVVASGPSQKRISGFNGSVYFTGERDNGSGSQLYRYNAQNGTASLVYAINPTGSSFPASYIVYGKNLYFAAYDDVHGIELWKYDGSNAPEMVVDLDTIGSSNPINMTLHKNKMYFSASHPDLGAELYMLVDSGVLTSVKNINFEANVRVYPNPASAETHIELDLKNNETLSVRVADMTGKVVFTSNNIQYAAGKNIITVPMAALPAGSYFYNITSKAGSNCVSGKILKQ